MKQPEVWMRGPLPGFPPLVQPIAHALLQAQEEIHEMLNGFPEHLRWEKPAGVASVAFHLQHITGVLDRLFTYAARQQLTPEQISYLNAEGKPDPAISIASLLTAFDQQLSLTLDELRHTGEKELTAPRGIGRKQIPTTLGGLLFHAAEHTMRHTGQLLVTVKILVKQ